MEPTSEPHVYTDILDSRQNKNLLFDFYGALLTQKQRDVFTMATMDDCSFGEIGQEFDITPQAVADTLKRATAQLHKYEACLGLVQKFAKQQQILQEVSTLLDRQSSIDTGYIKTLVGKLLL